MWFHFLKNPFLGKPILPRKMTETGKPASLSMENDRVGNSVSWKHPAVEDRYSGANGSVLDDVEDHGEDNDSNEEHYEDEHGDDDLLENNQQQSTNYDEGESEDCGTTRSSLLDSSMSATQADCAELLASSHYEKL